MSANPGERDATLATAAFVLILALAPGCFGVELPLLIGRQPVELNPGMRYWPRQPILACF